MSMIGSSALFAAQGMRSFPAGYSTTAKSAWNSAGMSMSVETASGGTVDEKSAAASRTDAAGRAADTLNMLNSLAKGFGDLGERQGFAVSTFDRSGHILAKGQFDKAGSLSISSYGSVGDAMSRVNLTVSSDGTGDWSARVAEEMARASYEINSMLGSPKASTSSGVNALI